MAPETAAVMTKTTNPLLSDGEKIHNEDQASVVDNDTMSSFGDDDNTPAAELSQPPSLPEVNAPIPEIITTKPTAPIAAKRFRCPCCATLFHSEASTCVFKVFLKHALPINVKLMKEKNEKPVSAMVQLEECITQWKQMSEEEQEVFEFINEEEKPKQATAPVTKKRRSSDCSKKAMAIAARREENGPIIDLNERMRKKQNREFVCPVCYSTGHVYNQDCAFNQFVKSQQNSKRQACLKKWDDLEPNDQEVFLAKERQLIQDRDHPSAKKAGQRVGFVCPECQKKHHPNNDTCAFHTFVRSSSTLYNKKRAIAINKWYALTDAERQEYGRDRETTLPMTVQQEDFTLPEDIKQESSSCCDENSVPGHPGPLDVLHDSVPPAAPLLATA